MKFHPERVNDSGKPIKVTEAMRKKPPPDDGTDSYLHEYTEGQWAVVINQDKVSEYHKKKVRRISKNIIRRR